MSKQRISVAASAILRHVAEGGWIGASVPMHIKAVRACGIGYRSAFALANERAARAGWDLKREIRRNFDDAAADIS